MALLTARFGKTSMPPELVQLVVFLAQRNTAIYSVLLYQFIWLQSYSACQDCFDLGAPHSDKCRKRLREGLQRMLADWRLRNTATMLIKDAFTYFRVHGRCRCSPKYARVVVELNVASKVSVID